VILPFLFSRPPPLFRPLSRPFRDALTFPSSVTGRPSANFRFSPSFIGAVLPALMIFSGLSFLPVLL